MKRTKKYTTESFVNNIKLIRIKYDDDIKYKIDSCL